MPIRQGSDICGVSTATAMCTSVSVLNTPLIWSRLVTSFASTHPNAQDVAQNVVHHRERIQRHVGREDGEHVDQAEQNEDDSNVQLGKDREVVDLPRTDQAHPDDGERNIAFR